MNRFSTELRWIGYASLSLYQLFKTSGRTFLLFYCSSSVAPIAGDNMLENMVRWRDGVVFGTVDVPSNDIPLVAARADMSYNFSGCVLACAIFGRCSLG